MDLNSHSYYRNTWIRHNSANHLRLKSCLTPFCTCYLARASFFALWLFIYIDAPYSSHSCHSIVSVTSVIPCAKFVFPKQGQLYWAPNKQFRTFKYDSTLWFIFSSHLSHVRRVFFRHPVFKKENDSDHPYTMPQPTAAAKPSKRSASMQDGPTGCGKKTAKNAHAMDAPTTLDLEGAYFLFMLSILLIPRFYKWR